MRPHVDSTPEETGKTDQVGQVYLLSAAHFINDMYPGFLAPLLPLLMTKIGFNLTMAAALSSILSTSNSLSQPIFGHIADREKKPYMAIFGPLVTALFMGSIGLWNSYTALVVVMILSGSAGHALGAVIILPIVTWLGMKYSLITMIAGFAIFALMLRRLSAQTLEPYRTGDEYVALKNVRRRLFLVILFSVGLIRAFLIVGFITFIPIYLHGKAMSLLLSGSAVTLFELSGAAGALAGLPLLFLFVVLRGVPAFIALSLGGLILYSSIPVLIIMAQELFPARVNVVSSIMIGLSWGIGGLLVTPLGALADRFGVPFALQFLTIFGSTALVASFLLTEPGRKTGIRISR
jgi:FSR family fosmidomycin resistance protein-like MFS transporter